MTEIPMLNPEDQPKFGSGNIYTLDLKTGKVYESNGLFTTEEEWEFMSGYEPLHYAQFDDKTKEWVILTKEGRFELGRLLIPDEYKEDAEVSQITRTLMSDE